MSKEILPLEYKVTMKDGTTLYEGFNLPMVVKTYARVDADKRYERRGEEEWKVKFYKPEANAFDTPKVFK
jgi:hypothetical protein